MLKRLRSFLRGLTSRRAFEAAMSDELQFHIEQYTADLIGSGVKPEEAARRARIEFGALSSVEEECRETRGIHFIEAVHRQALRILLRGCRPPH